MKAFLAVKAFPTVEVLSALEIFSHVPLTFPCIGILRLLNWTLRVTARELHSGGPRIFSAAVSGDVDQGNSTSRIV